MDHGPRSLCEMGEKWIGHSMRDEKNNILIFIRFYYFSKFDHL